MDSDENRFYRHRQYRHAIAGQLLKGRPPLLVPDLRRANAEKLLAAGAEWVTRRRRLPPNAMPVATCLPRPERNGSGLPRSRRPCRKPESRRALYRHTTTRRHWWRHVHALLAEKGVAMLDARSRAAWRARRHAISSHGRGEVRRLRARPPLDAIASASSIPARSAPARSPDHAHCASFTLDMLIAECWTTGVRPASTRRRFVRVFNEGRRSADDEPQGAGCRDSIYAGDFAPRFSLALARKISVSRWISRAKPNPDAACLAVRSGIDERSLAAGPRATPRSRLTLQEERARPRFVSA